MTIKAGDLVMVTRPTRCCGSAYGIGKVLTVERVQSTGEEFCIHCFRDSPGEHAAFSGHLLCGVYRLTKIDPPAVQTEETATKELQTT